MKFWVTACLVTSMLAFVGCSSDKKKKNENNTTAPTTTTSTDANVTLTTPDVLPETKEKEVKEFKSEKITLKDITGKEIAVTSTEKGFVFSGYENKVVLVNFFTTWCPPCKAEIPHLNNLQSKYKDNLIIISVLLEENKSNEELMNFAKFNGINFVITNSIENFKFAQMAGGVKNIPLMFLYDKEGKYTTHYVGAVPEEMVDSDIKRVL